MFTYLFFKDPKKIPPVGVYLNYSVSSNKHFTSNVGKLNLFSLALLAHISFLSPISFPVLNGEVSL